MPQSKFLTEYKDYLENQLQQVVKQTCSAEEAAQSLVLKLDHACLKSTREGEQSTSLLPRLKRKQWEMSPVKPCLLCLRHWQEIAKSRAVISSFGTFCQGLFTGQQ